jgi:hypothetical protein
MEQLFSNPVEYQGLLTEQTRGALATAVAQRFAYPRELLFEPAKETVPVLQALRRARLYGTFGRIL